MAVFQVGERSDRPQLVARTIVRIIGTAAPARYHLVGPRSGTRGWPILPRAAVRSVISRRFRLTA